MFQKKRMNVVASESGATVLQFAELRKELFSPSDPTNAEKKATWKYLSVSESPVSFQGYPKEVQRDCLVVKPLMIGARVPLRGQLISCKNTVVSG